MSGTSGGPIVAGSPVVFRQRAHRRQHEGEHQRLLQPERRRSGAVAVRAGPQPPGVLRSDVRERQRPRHLAGDAAQPSQRCSGTAEPCAGRARARRPVCRSPQRSHPKPWASSAGRSLCRRPRGRRRSRTALLVEAGFGGTYFGVGNFERSPNPTRDLIRVAEQCASGCAANGSIPGLVYRSQDFSVAYTGSYLWKGSVSYVTGTHSLKVGYQHTLMTDDRTWFTNNQNLTYRVNNGVPNQLTQSISPWVNNARAAWDGAVRPGAVDARPPDAAGRAAIRSRAELVSRAAGRAVAIPADADRHSGDARRRQLQGHHAEDRRRVRPVRDRQDGAQDEPREISGGRRRRRATTPTPIPRCGCRRRRRCSARPA